MIHPTSGEALAPQDSGPGLQRPRICVADRKAHIRTFLAESLDDLGFVTGECGRADDLPAILATQSPDLIVIGLSVDGIEAGKILEILATRMFRGRVLAIGPRDSIIVLAVQKLAEHYGIAMLAPLSTPFSAGTLRDAVATLLPKEPPARPAVDVAEALKSGWLELWYQRKIDTRTLVPSGAEAMVRMRHPSWGVVPPDYFLPDASDPHFRALSHFVISRAIEDWKYLLKQQGPVDLSINLPVAFFSDPRAVHDLCRWMPADQAFGGLLIEIQSEEVIANLDLVIDVAKQVRPYNIAISIDGLGADWPALLHLDTFPFVEMKVDRTFVTGCADDRLKQTVCRHIVELAAGYGARTVATGIETRADYMTAHGIGFDLVQGYLFGKPMGITKFARNTLGRPMQALG